MDALIASLKVAFPQLAHDVRVGDVVEFEAGVPVTVTDIEENYAPEDDPSPHGLRAAGRSLVFGAVFGDRDDPMAVRTFYVRRERSPLSGDRVYRL